MIQYFVNKWQKGVADELKKIINLPHKSRVQKLGDFWDKHWKELTDFISFKDWNILLQKWTDKDPNGHYEAFYETVKGVFGDAEFTYKKDNYLKTWMFKDSAFASVKAKLWWAENISATQVFWYRWNDSKHLAKTYYSRLEDIKTYPWLSREDRYKLFSDIYNTFEEKVRNAFWWYINRVNLKKPAWEFPSDLAMYNLILDYWDDKRETREEFLKHAFETFMDNEIVKPNKIEDEEEEIKDKVVDIMDYNEKNDPNFTKAENPENSIYDYVDWEEEKEYAYK